MDEERNVFQYDVCRFASPRIPQSKGLIDVPLSDAVSRGQANRTVGLARKSRKDGVAFGKPRDVLDVAGDISARESRAQNVLAMPIDLCHHCGLETSQF